MVDSVIILLNENADEKILEGKMTDAITYLNNAISCVVTEERNGEFELEMEYPINTYEYSFISDKKLIFTKASKHNEKLQLFRIYDIVKSDSMISTIRARHISYDMLNYQVSYFEDYIAHDERGEYKPTAKNSFDKAIQHIITNRCISDAHPAEDYTKIEFNSKVKKTILISGDDKIDHILPSVDTVKTLKAFLMGSENSILDIFGGEYEFDNWTINLETNRGSENKNVIIEYGENLKKIDFEYNSDGLYTDIFPYYIYEGSNDLVSGWKIFVTVSSELDTTSTSSYTNIKDNKEKWNMYSKINKWNANDTKNRNIYMLDTSQYIQFEEPELLDNDTIKSYSEKLCKSIIQLILIIKKVAEDFWNQNSEIFSNTLTPTVTVDFEQLNNEEYDNLSQISLCDTVYISHPYVENTLLKAKCIKTSYDVLTDNYISLELGSIRKVISDYIIKK